MKYYDFDIWIGTLTGDHYATRAHSESLGEKQGTLLVAEIDQAGVALDRLAGGEIDESYLKQVGSSLFSALFSGAIGILYQQALGQVYADDNAGVRIRLRLEPPDVAALPWELLFDSGRDCFLATSSETLLTRYVELPKPIRELQTALPIKILVIVPDGSGLDAQDEKQTVLGALEGLGEAVETHVLEGRVTAARINRELVLKQFHILHFIGRGGFLNDKGGVLLNRERGAEDDLVTAKEFSYHFQDYPCMKLVVLDSCNSAESSPHSLTDVAQELVRMGAPAVISTGGKISGEAAKLFAEDFYLKLCLGYERGRVDIAVSHARRRMVAEFADTDEFASPVLFMRSPKGVIFDLGQGEGTTSVRELHTLRAVTRTHEYNIDQIRKEGGEDAASSIAKETQAQSKVRARVLQFYKRIALSAVPRVAVMALVMTVVVFFASHTRVLNAFRVDDYLSGALRLWSDVPDKPFSPDVKIVLAKAEGNGTLGSPVDNPGWRTYHAEIIRGLAAVEKKPKVVVFDLEFNGPGPDDAGFARDISSARSQKVQVVGGQKIDNYGRIREESTLNSTLQPAFEDSWGDVEVGGILTLPLLPGGSAFINQYEVASLPPNAAPVDGEMPVMPSLALQAVMQAFAAAGNPTRATYNELAQEVILRAINSGGRVEKQIPVTRDGLSLEMLMDYSPQQDLDGAVKKYHDVYQWAKDDKGQLERVFRDKIVLIGYNMDSFRVIGDGQRSGVEIHANAVSNILNEIYVHQISRVSDFAIIMFMVGLGVLLQTFLRRRLPADVTLRLPYIRDLIGEIKVPMVLFSALVVYLLVAYLVYSRHRVSFDMSYHIAALLFGYWLIAIFRKKLRLA